MESEHPNLHTFKAHTDCRYDAKKLKVLNNFLAHASMDEIPRVLKKDKKRVPPKTKHITEHSYDAQQPVCAPFASKRDAVGSVVVH